MVRIQLGNADVLKIPGFPGGTVRATRNGHRVDTNSPNNNANSSGSVTSSHRVNFEWTNFQPRIVVTSDTEEFDEEIITHFQQEGYQIRYLQYAGDKSAFKQQLQHLADPLEFGESYAIIAYGDAATLVLEACMTPMPKLSSVIAYYPPYMPRSNTNFPPTLQVLIHLAGEQKFGTRYERNFRYPGAKSGFAESDLDEYSKPDARVAWSRTIATLRRGFGMHDDLESVWDVYRRLQFEGSGDGEKDVEALIKGTVDDGPYLNCVPTMTGGVGQRSIKRFYKEVFMPGRPTDFSMKLLSRTVGSDRIVDEMLVKFTHSVEMEWILPGVPATGKAVEVVVVVIAAIRGGRLVSENMHWDQASVLVQVGLLDPKYVPGSFKTKQEGKKEEMTTLPVLGAEAARKVVDEDVGKSNELISGWRKHK